MPRTDTLTHKELVLLRAVRDEYLKLGLATGRTDRGEAQAAISEAYAVAGLKPPKIWIWLGSPWAGCVGAWMISRLPIGMTRVRNQVWTQILRQVVGQTVAELGDLAFEGAFAAGFVALAGAAVAALVVVGFAAALTGAFAADFLGSSGQIPPLPKRLASTLDQEIPATSWSMSPLSHAAGIDLTKLEETSDARFRRKYPIHVRPKALRRHEG